MPISQLCLQQPKQDLLEIKAESIGTMECNLQVLEIYVQVFIDISFTLPTTCFLLILGDYQYTKKTVVWLNKTTLPKGTGVS